MNPSATLSTIVFLIWATLFAAFWAVPGALSQEYPNCSGWIPYECCCTRNSCYEVQPGEMSQIGPDLYRVNATGQVVKRKNWSRDGRMMACAYSYDDEKKDYVTGRGQPVMCLFIPIPSS